MRSAAPHQQALTGLHPAPTLRSALRWRHAAFQDPMPLARRLLAALVAALACSAVLADRAEATFHFMSISELGAGFRSTGM